MVNFGQVICGVVAVDPIVAQDAIKLIRVRYEELEPTITIEARRSFFSGTLYRRRIDKMDIRSINSVVYCRRTPLKTNRFTTDGVLTGNEGA